MEQQSINWKYHESVLVGYTQNNMQIKQKKILGLDMDGTIIKVKSGAKFSRDKDDWMFFDEKKVIEKLREKQNDYSIIIFSNQNGISLGHQNVKDLMYKIEKIQQQLKVELQVYLATKDDKYRKPHRGMWEMFLKVNKIKEKEIQIEECIYVGDAAGRKKNKNLKGDHSDVDIKFALNIGCAFELPESFFLGQKQVLEKIESVGDKYRNNKELLADGKELQLNKENSLVIMVGSPGSGKSVFCCNQLQDYQRVNRDSLGSMDKCYQQVSNLMEKNQNIVVDNTNPTVQARAKYIELAQSFNYNVTVIVMSIPKELAIHMDKQRLTNSHRIHFSKKVGKIPIHTFYKNYQKPTKQEGVHQVYEVQFVPKFLNNKDEQSFFQFT